MKLLLFTICIIFFSCNKEIVIKGNVSHLDIQENVSNIEIGLYKVEDLNTFNITKDKPIETTLTDSLGNFGFVTSVKNNEVNADQMYQTYPIFETDSNSKNREFRIVNESTNYFTINYL